MTYSPLWEDTTRLRMALLAPTHRADFQPDLWGYKRPLSASIAMGMLVS
jgi:hypothetical protein